MKKTHMIKSHFRLLMAFALLMAVFLVSVIPVQNASAAEDLSQSECHARLNGKATNASSIVSNQSTYNFRGCVDAGYCKVDLDSYTAQNSAGSYTCTKDPRTARKNATGAALAANLCSHSSREMGQAGYTSADINRCKSAVADAWDQCAGEGSGQTSSGATPGGGVDDQAATQATCLKRLMPPGRITALKNMSPAELKQAILDARGEGTAAQEDQNEAVKKQECEQDGKVWQDGECVDPEAQVSCAIDGIGWIVCPTMTLLAKMNDRAFSFLAGNFLELDAAGLRDNKDLKNAWETFRTLANGAFVIAFLVIIYGQMTGRGN